MNKMADIPNTGYITVKRDENGGVDVFVGGKPATTYRGVEIYGTNFVIKDAFARIQKYDPNVTELHVLSSETSGFAKVGNPSPEHGRYAWCRVKNNYELGGWVFAYEFSSASYCAYDCTARCALLAWGVAALRHAVLVTAFDNGQNGENAQSDDLGRIDWSQKLGVHNVGPYEIIVKKVGPNTK